MKEMRREHILLKHAEINRNKVQHVDTVLSLKFKVYSVSKTHTTIFFELVDRRGYDQKRTSVYILSFKLVHRFQETSLPSLPFKN